MAYIDVLRGLSNKEKMIKIAVLTAIEAPLYEEKSRKE